MSHSFATPRFPSHCACCDAKLLDTCPTCTTHNLDLGYRRVHFALSDGSETFVSLCTSCAEHEWTDARLTAFSQQCQEGWVRGGWEPGGTLTVVRPLNRPVQMWAQVQ